MAMQIFELFLFLILINQKIVSGEECELADKCRLVDINGSEDWLDEPGHYKSIQDCIDEIVEGDTCLIRSGRYHEQIQIVEKNNIAIRGDLDFERPILDGTMVLKPLAEYDSDGDGVADGKWKEDEINGQKVCIGEIQLHQHKHPFQLFLKESVSYEMMTNARWPNAIWTDRHERTGAPLVFYNDYWGKSDSSSERGKMVDRPVNGTSPLAASGLEMKGAMAILNTGSFMSWVRPVLEHKAGDDFFTYNPDFNNNKFSASHNQYYLDSLEALLDIPGEWFYDKHKKVLKFMPLSGVCPDANSDVVRGRILDYAINITHTDGLYISDLDFFGSNLRAHEKINDIYLDSLNFMYPSSSKRMLQDYSIPSITYVVGDQKHGETVSIENCVFFGGEGSALHWAGANGKVKNNLFQWNDWTGQQGDPLIDDDTHGGCGTVFTSRNQKDEEFVGNTFWYNGASAGYMPGEAPLVSDNWVVGQCDGLILNDGSGITTGSSCQPGSKILSNWIFDSPKSGLRFDGGHPPKNGYNGTMAYNVLWKVGGYVVKGEHHNITGNLALPNRDETDGVLKVIYILRKDDTYIMNNDTIVEDNAAWLADGGRDAITDPHDQGNWNMAGIKSNNFYGNNSYLGHDNYDGSVVLDGEVVPELNGTDLLSLLVDPESHDFRPKPDSILTATGNQIGPFASEWSNGDQYRMAGRKEYLPSRPIPKHNSEGLMRDSLIFHQAYRCNGDGDKHMIYIAKESSDFPSIDEPTTEMNGDGNVVVFDDVGFTVSPGKLYKWRVDCVEGESSKRRSGDVWMFKMSSEKN